MSSREEQERIFHFSLFIISPYSLLPLGEGLGMRGGADESRSRKPLSPTLSQGEREFRKNDKWKMGRSLAFHRRLLFRSVLHKHRFDFFTLRLGLIALTNSVIDRLI